MPELPADFDLKLMPDWLKEPAGKNPYADYEGRDEERRPRGGDGWGGGRGRGDDRRGRPGGGQRPGGAARGDGPRRDDRPRNDGPGGRKPDAKRPAGRPEDRRGRPGDAPRRTDDRDRPPQEPQGEPANVSVEFFPDDGCSASIAKQVKSTHRAYSLFDLARMFLARPERHRLRIAAKSVAEPLHQVGENGAVWTDRAAAERTAFQTCRADFYVEVTEQRDPPKGNFSNVARCRANGILLGPTNYHGYQPALRRMYDERFSRRMSFQDFQREIEVVTDPALVEQWKQQASSVTVYHLAPKPAPAEKAKRREATEPATPAETPVAEAAEAGTPDAAPEIAPEIAPDAAPTVAPEASVEAPEQNAAEAPEPPAAQEETAVAENPEADEPPAAPAAAYDGPVFASLADAEQHFKEHYLPGLIRTGTSFHLTGTASRAIVDRGIAAAVRQAWEQERGFPGQMMHQLRQQFTRAGLHVFKHRKRMQFVSLIRPSPMENGSLSSSVAEILTAIQGAAACNRTSLAAALLGTDEAAVDQARKTALATDLRWLIETGRVIEFSEGRLELPLVPAKTEPQKADTAPGSKTVPDEAPITAETPATSSEELVGEPSAAHTPVGIVEQPDAEPISEPIVTAAEPVASAEEPVTVPAAPEPPEA
jgi:hypothetical protein